MNKFIRTLFPRFLAPVTTVTDIETERLDPECRETPAAAATTNLAASSEQYSFQHHRLFYDGLVQLQIIKRSGLKTEIVSQYELLGSCNCDLLLAEWLDNTHFIAVDNTGRIYSAVVNDVTSHKLSLSAIAALDLYPTKDVWIDNGMLWVLGAPKAGRRSANSMFSVKLAISNNDYIEIDDTDISCYDMPFEFVAGSMVCAQGTEFVFYQRENNRMHQLMSFNPITAKSHRYPLNGKPAPTDISFRNTFFMDKDRGVALLANTETLSLFEAGDGSKGFDFELQLIDFKQKGIVWSHKVRALAPAQICDDYQAEELIESLSTIAAGDISSTHHDELQTFIECLTSAVISADGNSIWLGWQDGVVQQLSLTGEPISPLYKLMQASRDGKPCSAQVFEYDSIVIKGQIDNQLIVAVGDDEDGAVWLLEWAAKQAEGEQTAVPVVCQPLQLNLAMPSKLLEVPSVSGQVDICLQDVNDAAAKICSLAQLNSLMPKLQKHYLNSSQTSLFFAFVAQQVNSCAVLSEYDLFATAAYDEKGAALLASIIKQFASWSCAANLSGLKGAPVMADAVLGLANKRQYLAILAEYFVAIGAQELIHPFHVHRTMKVIRQEHANTPELADFMAKVPWPWNDESFTVANIGDYD